MNALVPVTAPALPVELTAALELAVDFAKASKARSTLEAYRSDLAIFCAWCAAHGLCAMPPAPSTICAFLAAEAAHGKRPSTIARRLAATKWGIEERGLLGETEKCPTDHRTVRDTMAGIRRSMGAAPRRKAALTNDLLLAGIAQLQDSSLRGLRDKAIVLLGFGGALRRSELTALNVEELEFCDSGLRVRIRRSKTDQAGEGVTIAVAAGRVACPAATLKAWLEASGITSGPLFVRIINKINQRLTTDRLHPRNVASIVKKLAARLGLAETEYSAHSLRAGFLTSAAARGASVFKMKEVSRHKSLDVLGGYVRDANLFRDHAGANLL
jgi:site-specific recombinase XerD